MKLFQAAALGVFLVGWTVQAGGLPPESFPVDDAMRVQVDFWKKVYTEITSDEAFLHDEDNLKVIYEKIRYPEMSPRKRKRYVKEQKKRIERILLSIIKKKERRPQ